MTAETTTENTSTPAPSFKPRKVTCPACGSDCMYAPENIYRPFCSARCKGVDFGAWACENFRMPVADTKENTEDE